MKLKFHKDNKDFSTSTRTLRNKFTSSSSSSVELKEAETIKQKSIPLLFRLENGFLFHQISQNIMDSRNLIDKEPIRAVSSTTSNSIDEMLSQRI